MDLTPQQSEELVQALRARRDALTTETHAGAERAREETYRTLAGSVGDTGDDAVADMLTDIENAEIARDVGELREIEAALARVDEGSYGLCVQCGREIRFERLQVNPTAQRCIDCQSVFEKTFAQPGRATL
jgi:RNA polymerase-binding protein DksA